MKQITIIATAILLTTIACRPVKKINAVETAYAKKDSTTKVIVKETPKIDSAAIIGGIMQKVVLRKIDFQTFSAKIKVDYDGPEEGYQFQANIEMKKDSFIQVKLFTALTGVLFEAMINKDSVILLNKKKKIVQYRKISYLQDVTQIPFDFATLQDVIIGNPVFLNNNIVSYKNNQSELLVLLVGDVFKHFITLDNSDYKVLHSKLDDVDASRSRTCDITFDNYVTTDGFPFSTQRKISIAEKSKLDLKLDFKRYSFNTPLTNTFNIPKNFKRK